jgi:hypothetical protein
MNGVLHLETLYVQINDEDVRLSVEKGAALIDI